MNVTNAHSVYVKGPEPSGRTLKKEGKDSLFAKYLDVDAQIRKAQALEPERGLAPVSSQFREDYRQWKAGQPEQVLPDSKGWTEENLAFLRKHYAGELSAFELYDALETMRQMGAISQKEENYAMGSRVVTRGLEASLSYGPIEDNWLHGFDKAPIVGFRSLDNILDWLEAFRREEHPDRITEAQARLLGIL